MTRIITKNNAVTTEVPAFTDLVQGELAVNVKDGRLWTRDDGTTVVEIAPAEVAASDSVAGVVELATSDETNTGTSTTLAVTPDGLDDWEGSAQVTTLGTIGSLVATTADINGGTIDATTVGATGHSTGKFTTLEATGAATFGAEITEGVYSVSSSSGALTLDPVNGTIQTLLMVEDITSVTLDLESGEFVTLHVDADESAYTLDWAPTSMVWVGGDNSPDIDNSADVYNVFHLWQVGAQPYGSFVGVAS